MYEHFLEFAFQHFAQGLVYLFDFQSWLIYEATKNFKKKTKWTKKKNKN